MLKVLFISVVSFMGLSSCAQKNNKSNTKKDPKVMTTANTSTPLNMDTATFGTGCFWCTEAIFQQVEGVVQVNVLSTPASATGGVLLTVTTTTSEAVHPLAPVTVTV